jgi:hypothetical protein
MNPSPTFPHLHLWDWHRKIPPSLPALCGVLSTLSLGDESFDFTYANLIKLALFLLLVEGGWRLFWNIVAGYDWSAALESLGIATNRPRSVRDVLEGLATLRQSEAATSLAPHLTLALLSFAILLIIPAALGPIFAAYSLLVFVAVVCVRWVGRVPPIVEVILFALGPWWVGAVGWGGLTILSLGLSLAFAVCAGRGLIAGYRPWFYHAGFLAALVMLVLSDHAFVTGVVGLFYLAALSEDLRRKTVDGGRMKDEGLLRETND